MPGAVFQAVLIGGGYGTGREAVEYVTQAGPSGGLLAVLCFFLATTVVLICTFEFSRVFQVYDYRSFFRALLGRGWWLFEVLALVLMTLVLAVVISAATTMLFDWFALPQLVTTLGVIMLTAAVLYVGQGAVERLLSIWAVGFSLYLLLLAGWVFVQSGSQIADQLAASTFFTTDGLKKVLAAS